MEVVSDAPEDIFGAETNGSLLRAYMPRSRQASTYHGTCQELYKQYIWVVYLRHHPGYAMPNVIPCAVLAFFVALVAFHLSHRKYRPPPPGPPGLPIVGNAFQVIGKGPLWLRSAEWAKQYGDVVYISIFHRRCLLLNSVPAIKELLVTRGSIYSDRPHSVMVHELSGWQDFLPAQFYGERARRARKIFNDLMSPTRVSQWKELQENEARRFIARTLETPENWRDHLRLMIASSAIRVPTGLKVRGIDDPLIDIAERALPELVKAGTPGFLVDALPFLQYVPEWFPGARFKRQAKLWRETTRRLKEDAYLAVQDNLASISVSHSLLRDAILREGTLQQSYLDVLKVATGSMYAIAVGTVTGTLHWFLLAMMMYPDVQRKAQMEIDQTMEFDELPAFSHRSQLPYVDAVMKEVLRWQPVAPLSIPHVASVDDTYDNYHIQAGTVVISNVWAVLHDPILYPEPEKFTPERFIHSDHDKDLNPDPLSYGAFGFGRRICPGRYLAYQTLFITIAQLLAAFDIKPPSDAHGSPVIPEICLRNGLVSDPPHFECKISSRARMRS